MISHHLTHKIRFDCNPIFCYTIVAYVVLNKEKGKLFMIAIQIVDVKDFMTKMLYSELFDHFLLQEASITTFVNYTISGNLHHDFFSSDYPEYETLKDLKFSPFSILRPRILPLIKGTYTPLRFQFIFQLSPENQTRTIEKSGCNIKPEEISGMYLNIKYQNEKLLCTTGISYGIFSLDKSLEQEWDRLIQVFLKNNQVPFEIL